LMNPVDLGQVASALQGKTFAGLQLPKLEAFTLDVLDRLAAIEVQSAGYSKAAVELLLKVPVATEAAGGAESSRAAVNGSSKVRRVRTQQQQQQQHGSTTSRNIEHTGKELFGFKAAVEGLSSSSSSSSDDDEDDVNARSSDIGGRSCDVTGQLLKQRLVQLQQIVMEAAMDLPGAGMDGNDVQFTAMAAVAAVATADNAR
jgi:hypothetical protein